jgi:hypothetical protein
VKAQRVPDHTVKAPAVSTGMTREAVDFQKARRVLKATAIKEHPASQSHTGKAPTVLTRMTKEAVDFQKGRRALKATATKEHPANQSHTGKAPIVLTEKKGEALQRSRVIPATAEKGNAIRPEEAHLIKVHEKAASPTATRKAIHPDHPDPRQVA